MPCHGMGAAERAAQGVVERPRAWSPSGARRYWSPRACQHRSRLAASIEAGWPPCRTSRTGIAEGLRAPSMPCHGMGARNAAHRALQGVLRHGRHRAHVAGTGRRAPRACQHRSLPSALWSPRACQHRSLPSALWSPRACQHRSRLATLPHVSHWHRRGAASAFDAMPRHGCAERGAQGATGRSTAWSPSGARRRYWSPSAEGLPASKPAFGTWSPRACQHRSLPSALWSPRACQHRSRLATLPHVSHWHRRGAASAFDAMPRHGCAERGAQGATGRSTAWSPSGARRRYWSPSAEGLPAASKPVGHLAARLALAWSPSGGTSPGTGRHRAARVSGRSGQHRQTRATIGVAGGVIGAIAGIYHATSSSSPSARAASSASCIAQSSASCFAQCSCRAAW